MLISAKNMSDHQNKNAWYVTVSDEISLICNALRSAEKLANNQLLTWITEHSINLDSYLNTP